MIPNISDITGYQIAFVALAAMTVTSAVLVVTLPNILRSALFLAFTFLGIAGLYILANAEFIAAMQVLIYVGAVTVLIMFAIVLTQQLMGAKITQSTKLTHALIAMPVAAAAFAFFAFSFVLPFSKASGMVASEPAAASEGTLISIAKLLLQPYVLPFELVSLILLGALVGAVVMAKEDRE